MIYCRGCGSQIHETAVACPQCGAKQTSNTITNPESSSKSNLAALLLCFFFGVFGIHRFYVGKIGTGILSLLTLGLFGIWTLIDFIVILCGAFRDADNRRLAW